MEKMEINILRNWTVKFFAETRAFKKELKRLTTKVGIKTQGDLAGVAIGELRTLLIDVTSKEEALKIYKHELGHAIAYEYEYVLRLLEGAKENYAIFGEWMIDYYDSSKDQAKEIISEIIDKQNEKTEEKEDLNKEMEAIEKVIEGAE